MKSIGIIGTLVFDTIQPVDGPVCESWGGLAYAFLTLAAIAPDVRIVPVVNMGRDLHSRAIRDLAQWPNIDTRCIYPVSERTNHVTLKYYCDHERVEIQDGMQPPLTFEQLRPALECDMILMNFISGTDVEMGPYHQLCRAAQAPVYTDIHSMALGRRPDGTRFHRPIERSREWFRHSHILQMNETEANLLDRPEKGDGLLTAWLDDGLRAVIRTQGGAGLRYAFRQPDEKTVLADQPAFEPDKMCDPTGCGDAFGAAFCHAYLQSDGDVPASVNYANRIAGFMSQLRGLNEMERLAAFAASNHLH